GLSAGIQSHHQGRHHRDRTYLPVTGHCPADRLPALRTQGQRSRSGPPKPAGSTAMKALRNLPFLTTVAIFLLAYAICVIQFPNMLSTRVIGNLLTDNAFLGIAAVGMTFVIISGGIDLSVGSVIAFTSVFVAVMVGQLGVHPLVAFALILVIAALFGAWMGMMIHFLGIPPF